MYALGQIHVKKRVQGHFRPTLSLSFRPESCIIRVTIRFQNFLVSDYVVRRSSAMRVGYFGVGTGANREGIVNCDEGLRP